MSAVLPFDLSRVDLDQSPLDRREILSKPLWAELRTFLAVAKSRSLTQAGEIIGASAPTVSRDVKRLQDQIGAQLIVSGHAGVVLTPAGQQLAARVAQLDFQISSLVGGLRGERDAVSGKVTISVTSGLAVSTVAPALSRFSDSYPGLEITMRDQISFLNLEKNLADVMLAMAPIQHADVTCTRVGTLHLVPVASRSYVTTRGVPRRGTIGEHAVLQCSYYASDGEVWRAWNEIWNSGRGRHVFENSLAYFAMIKCGGGIGLLGTYVLADPALIPVDVGVHVPIPIYAVVLTDRLGAKPVQVVYEWLCDLFASNAMFGDKLVLQPGTSTQEEDWRNIFNVRSGSTDATSVPVR